MHAHKHAHIAGIDLRSFLRRRKHEINFEGHGGSLAMSSYSISQACVFAEDCYDLIVLDPPWENKSVKRKKR